jgi:hypothetical protein
MAEKHEGYVDGSEQFVAAVWYVAKEAQKEWEANQRKILKGRLSRWYFLTRIRKALGLPQYSVPYSVMRAELEEFALTFGVEGGQLAARRNIEAAKEFGS